MSHRLAALLAAALIALAAGACSNDDDDGGGSKDIPSGAVATVGDAEISEQDLETQVDALSRAHRGASSGGASSNGSSSGGSAGAATGGDEPAPQLRKQLEAQALSVLLMRQALEQEAADRGIEVSDAEVRERWDTASQGQFKTEKALRRFLGGQTEEELLAQLRLQVLAERIHEQVSERAGGGKKGAKAVKQFQRDFQKRWQDRTACRDGYTAAGCTGS